MSETTDNMIQSPTAWDIFALCDMSLPRFMQSALTPERSEIKTLAPSQKFDGVRMAVVPIMGVLTRDGWEYGTSSAGVGPAVLALAKSGQVDGIMLAIDSPGGSTSGVFESIDLIREAGEIVPVHSYIGGLGASGGYAFASAASRVSAGNYSFAGSIGTYSVVRDFSQLFAAAGIKTHVVSAGDFKGMLTPGTEVTDAQLTEIRRIVTQVNDLFLNSVSQGRGLSAEAVKAVADGRVHMATDAKALGLIDSVESFEASMAVLATAAMKKSPKMKGTRNMEETKQAGPVAATLTELKSTLPNSSAEFREGQIEAGATLAQAKQAWEVAERDAEIAKLKAENAALSEQKVQAEKQCVTAQQKKPGVSGLGTAGTETNASGDAVSDWNAAIKAEIDSGRDKVTATRNVIRDQPALHQNYLEAINACRTSRPFQPA